MPSAATDQFKAQVRILLPVALTGALFVARWARTGEPTFAFLLFNVGLAGVPLVFAHAAAELTARGSHRAALAALAGWLLFLPNAPYVITDLIHLRPRSGAPIWFDAALFGAAALAGLSLGVAAMARARSVIVELCGPVLTFLAMGLTVLLSGYGIYLGRFARLNSWDAVLHPHAVIADALPPLVDPFQHARAWVVTLVFASFLAVAYLAQPRPQRA